jgi:integrase
VYVPTDFAMDKTPAGFLWQGEDMSGIPRIRMPDGSICEILLRYFAYCRLHRIFRAKSSMESEAYSLREWFCHLGNLGLDWRAGSDVLMRSQRLLFASAMSEREVSAAQVELKMSHIFKFYQHIHKAVPYFFRKSTPVFVGLLGGKAPISAAMTGRSLSWTGADKIARAMTKRPTPDFDAIERIKEHLRSAANEVIDGTWEQALRIYAAERNWLIVRCEVDAGLRRAETANLSLRKLAEALSALRVVEIAKGRWAKKNARNPLSEAAGDPALQLEIIGAIERLQARGYETLNVVVAKKGGGERSVEFPLELVIDILAIGVWKVRKKLFERWQTSGGVKLDDDAVFFSSTGMGKSLATKRVGAVVNNAFAELGVEGSGHRLRAYYLTEMAWLLWNQALAVGGYRNDVAVTNHVLHRLASLAGHKSPSTTEQHYLDMAKARHKQKRNRSVLNARKDAINTHISVSWRLDESQSRQLERVILAFDGCKDPRLFTVIDAAIAKYHPSAMQPREPEKPKVQIVK